MVRRLVYGVLLTLATSAAIAWYLLHYHGDLAQYDALRLPPASAGVRVTWLGVSTLLVDDGETQLLTDGFFTRPGLLQLASLAPDATRIDAALARAHADRVAAVIVVHSHYDHVLDAPLVALRTNALLVGSASTARVGEGYGLRREQMRVVQAGETLAFGRFKLTVVGSVHSPRDMFPGAIEDAVTTPASASAFRTGECYSLWLEHDGRSLLIQASAGFVPGALAKRHADTVYLGVGNLGRQSSEYRAAYWREVVQAVGAARVVPIHWDDFFAPLIEPLPPMPIAMDDFDATMRDLQAYAKRDHMTLGLPRFGVPADAF